MDRDTGMMDKVLALTFVFSAFLAGFVVMHKDEILSGNIDQVVAGYVSDFKSSETQ